MTEHSNKKVLIISMEKCGTTTIMHTLQGAGIEVGRIHRHNIYDVNIDDYQYFIIPVREPVAKSLSNYFECAYNANLLLDLVNEIKFTINFFDFVVYPLLKTDVLNYYYSAKVDWFVIPPIEPKILTIKVESFNDELANALSILLDMPQNRFIVEHRAKGVVRFGSSYPKAVKEFVIDGGVLQEIAKSKYCKVFGYDKEITKWIK